MDFLKDLDRDVRRDRITQWVYKSTNSSLGASIVQIKDIQGYELALLNFHNDGQTSINWHCPELGGIFPGLTEQEVNDLLVKISEL